MRINKLILQDFKFFNGKYELKLNGNNLLIFGENGSGKSSLYWALYTFLQSSIKSDNEVKKYFDISNSQNLINRYAKDPKPSIGLELIDSEGRTYNYTISKETVNTNKDDNTTILEANFASDFINYRVLSRVYDFRNSQDINLFEVFEKDILDYIRLETIENAGQEWQELKKGLNPRPNMSTSQYKDFQARIQKFNEEFERYLKNILEDANNFLQNDFDINIKLEWNYQKATYDDFVSGSTTKRNHKTIAPKIILKAKYLDDKIENDEILKPHTFLNEAKLTAIALSIRLAVLKERLASAGLKVLVLDDLLISLDMNNRDIVLDIILKQFNDMQILIMTHDEMFFEFAKHKIKQISNSFNWYFWKMYEGNRDVPKPYITDSKTYLQKAEEYLIKNEYEIAGNFLRKEAERFCKDFLPKKYHYTKQFNLRDLNGLILQAKEFAKNAGMNIDNFEKLDRFRKFVLNISSHDSYDVPKYKQETKECLETLKELNKIKSVKLPINEKMQFELKDNEGSVWKIKFSLEEEFKVIILNGSHYLSKGLINYEVYKNSDTEVKVKHTSKTIENFYKGFYKKSDKTKSEDYLEEIVLEDGRKLKDILEMI